MDLIIIKDNNKLLDSDCFVSTTTEVLKVVNKGTDNISLLNISSEHVSITDMSDNPINYEFLQLQPNSSYQFKVKPKYQVEARTPFSIEVDWI